MNSIFKSPLRVLAAAGILVSCQGNSNEESTPGPYSLGLSHEYITTEFCGHCERIERRLLFDLDTSGDAFLMYRHTIEYGTANGDETIIEEFAGRANRLKGKRKTVYERESKEVQTPLVIEAFSYDSSLHYFFWLENDDLWSLSNISDSTLNLEKKWLQMN